MKRKVFCFVLALFAIAIFSLGCGGGGGSSNPASSNIAGQARVSGVVVDSSNNPVPNAKVSLVLASNALMNSLTSNTNSTLRFATKGNQTEFSTITNHKGEYTFTNVPYGEYTLSAITEDRTQIVARLSVNANDQEIPNIVLMPFGSISGVVTDGKEQPIKGAVVYIDGTSYCSITDDFGGYTLKYVPVNTALKLCAMSSGFETKTNSVTIDPKQKLDLDSENEEVNFSLTALTTTTKFCSVKCSISGDGANLNNLLVLAVSDDGKNAYVAQSSNGVATICITTPGKYNIIPASLYNGTNVAGTSQTLEISGKEIQSNGSKDLTLSIGKPAYATLSGSIDNTNISDTQFEVHLIDGTGHDRKQIKTSNDLNFTFNNVPDGNYKIIVCSDNTLYVSSNYGISDGKGLEIPSPLTPVVVTPTVTVSNGIAEVKIANALSNNNSGEVFFSVYGYDSESNPVLLYGYDETNKKVILASESYDASSVSSCVVCTDNCSKLGFIKFFFYNELNRPVFEKTYATSSEIVPNNAKLSLKVNDSTNLKQTDDIILFKAIEFQGKLYYLVVTSRFTYVFDGETGNIATLSGASGSGKYSFNSKFENFSSIKYGNACFIPSSSETTLPSMAVQYANPNSSCSSYYVYKYDVSSLFDGSTSGLATPYLKNSNISGYFDVEKIIGRTKSDNTLEFYSSSGSTFNKITQNTSNNTVGYTSINIVLGSEIPPDAEVLSSIVLFEPDSGNKLVVYFLVNDSGNTYLGKNTYDADNNDVEKNFLIPLGAESNYTLTDCLDNYDAENKVFINENYNWNNGNPTNVDPKYVFSNTIYSGSNIKSSYLKISLDSNQYLDTWIERNSSGQKLVLRNLTNYKEKKINIKQVLNSSAYLEGSIGFTTVNGNQIHVLCTDDSGNIQVMVVNCVNGQQ